MNLQLGDKSEDVKKWKLYLVSQGYAVTDGSTFDVSTDKATRTFQKKYSLTVDGRVGPKTIAAAAARGLIGFIASPVDPKGRLILVSAGHTNVQGQDRGVGAGRFVEGVEAVRLRDTIAAVLRDQGLSVLEDGADGINDPLKKALELARRADSAIELHFNASSNSTATGIEVLAKPRHRGLAQKIAGAIKTATNLSLRGGDSGFKADNSGQHHRLAFCEAGGMIVEVCFLTNPSDMNAYEENLEAVARGIADVLATA